MLNRLLLTSYFRFERFQGLERFKRPKFILDKYVIFAKLTSIEIERE